MTLILCLDPGTECWECGGSSTPEGVTEPFRLHDGSGAFCSRECRLSFVARSLRERERHDARCSVCDSPPGECVTEFQDVDGSMTPWPHEYLSWRDFRLRQREEAQRP